MQQPNYVRVPYLFITPLFITPALRLTLFFHVAIDDKVDDDRYEFVLL